MSRAPMPLDVVAKLIHENREHLSRVAARTAHASNLLGHLADGVLLSSVFFFALEMAEVVCSLPPEQVEELAAALRENTGPPGHD